MDGIQIQILDALKARDEADWTDVLKVLPPQTNSSEAWGELEEMEKNGLIWVVTRITKIPGKAESVRVPVLKLRREAI